MGYKIYSRLDEIPSGNAPETVTEGCIALEGGAFRGVYTNGVMDALMEEGICFRTTYGVSAGAMNAINYVSGQIGRSARVNLRFRHDSRYVGKDALKGNRGIVGFDFVFGDLPGIEPLNRERLMDPATELFAVAACLETGKAEALGKGSSPEDVFKAVQASASMPYIAMPVEIGGKHYLDGGCACKIPYRFPLERGFEKIVVVRTRPRTYRKKLKTSRHFDTAKLVYRRYPEFIVSLARSGEDYNRQCDELELLEARGRIFVMAPSRPVTVGRFEGSMGKLGELYRLGYNDAKERIPALKEYLALPRTAVLPRTAEFRRK